MITIIGAGPVGNYLAYKLAKQGKEVRVVEEHKEIGKPVQCTGIFTSEIEKLVKLEKDFFVNRIKKAKIFSSKKNFVEIKLQKENVVLNREKFDFHLHKLAEKEGAKFILGKRFNGNEGNKIKIGQDYLNTDYLVGADGPFSSVAKHNGLLGNRQYVVGAQTRLKGIWDKELIEFFPGVGCFGWIVPENEEVARVGVISYKNPNEDLKKLLNLRCPGFNVVDRQGGFVPVYNPKQKLTKDNVMLIGDAATQVKATTFGGVVPGLMAANAMADNFNNYEKEARKRLHKDLYYSFLMRKVMDRFNNKEYEDLIKMVKKDKVRKVLEETNRDFPSKFLFKLLLKEPKFLKYSTKLIF